MKVIPLKKLCKTEYHIKFLDGLIMPQKPTNPDFSCLDSPKKQDLILFVKDCKTKYITKDKKTITTKPGQIVYIPTESEYKVSCTENLSENASTLQINFRLFDDKHEPCILSDDIIIFTSKDHELQEKFENAILLDEDFMSFPTEKRSVLYSILNSLASEDLSGKSHKVIEPGMEYLHTNYQKNCSVADLADICHISEEYFRKLFKIQTGKNPAEYRNMLRMQKAEQYLIHSDISIAEVAEMLGYATVSHFIKQFKNYKDISPLSYRKKHRN